MRHVAVWSVGLDVWVLPLDPHAHGVCLPRTAVERAARETPLVRWCGLTAAEILVRLDEWLSGRNG